MRKRKAKGNERKLHIKRGEKITFPVPANHRFAKFQKLTPVRSPEDIYHFLLNWAQIAKAKGQPPPNPKTLVEQFARGKSRVFHLTPSLIRIAKGAVLTLNNPLNQLDADSIEIEGDLVS